MSRTTFRMYDDDDRSRRGPPKRMSDLLATLLARKGYAQVRTVEECQEVWQEIVGSRFGSCCRPANLRQGVLEIVVNNSTALQELTFQKSELLRQINRRLPEQQIKALRLRVGVITSNGN